jgi:uncharacterized repeat protein (TIGR02543 family)
LTWGSNEFGQLGVGTVGTASNRTTPTHLGTNILYSHESIKYIFNETLSENIPLREGYNFDGWFTNSTLTQSYTFSTMPAQNITLYAKWAINQITISQFNHLLMEQNYKLMTEIIIESGLVIPSDSFNFLVVSHKELLTSELASFVDALRIITNNDDTILLETILNEFDPKTLSIELLNSLLELNSKLIDSLVSSVVIETNLVDASGLLLQINIAGHYSIENPPIFNPVGWAQHQYIVEIYSNGALIRTRNYNNSNPIVHFQTPGDSNGLLAGLAPGEYTVHIIMVGNGTTHINSAPFIKTFTYVG